VLLGYTDTYKHLSNFGQPFAVFLLLPILYDLISWLLFFFDNLLFFACKTSSIACLSMCKFDIP
jgi:hypothetical protein